MAGLLIAVVLGAAALSAGLIVVLRPLLARHALAHPNARSSHAVPTPQGGGIAVIAATGIVATVALLSGPERAALAQLWPLVGAVVLLAVVGAVDDLRTIAVLPRLLLQFAAVIAVIATLPDELRVIPALPVWIERVVLALAVVWFVNLTNFMDGIDWMTVAEVVPITAGFAILSLMGALPVFATIVALALLGATLGFAPFNRPVARLFLGDVGSLPIGVLLFWLLVELAGHGRIAAALLLPLYYLADATVTLLARAARGESVLQAHRCHFYQRARDRGLPVPAIIRRVFAVNVLLVALAVASVWMGAALFDIAALVGGAALVGWLLASLAKGAR